MVRDFRIQRLEDDILEASRRQNIWPIVQRMRRSSVRTKTPIHGVRGLVYDAPSKAEAVADTLETSFIPHIAEDSAFPWIHQVK